MTKSCPCCNGKAIIDYGSLNTYIAEREGKEPSGCHEVRCMNCGLSTGWHLDSVARWNNRPHTAYHKVTSVSDLPPIGVDVITVRDTGDKLIYELVTWTEQEQRYYEANNIVAWTRLDKEEL